MSVESLDLTALAAQVDQAAVEARPIAQLSHSHPLTVAQAYAVQAASLARRYARGESLIGLKMGFTSQAKMEQMGVHDMIWGRLTDAMLLEDGGVLDFAACIHPRAEPELCFRVSQPIAEPIARDAVLDYIDGVAAAVEVIDSRYQNFSFSLADVIADNCSSSAFVVGPWHDLDRPLEDLAMTLKIDGTPVHAGTSAAILGDPWASVVAATRLASQYGQSIPEGAYLMAGAATPAVYLKPGQAVAVEVEALGTVGFKVR